MCDRFHNKKEKQVKKIKYLYFSQDEVTGTRFILLLKTTKTKKLYKIYITTFSKHWMSGIEG